MHTTTPTDTPTGAPLLSLLWLASPTLPIGGFSYSEGLEAAVHSSLVHDEASASDWIVGQLWQSQARSDLPVIAQALPAWHQHHWARLQALDDWVRHTRESAELRLQTEQMGRSLMEWAKSLQDATFDLSAVPAALRQPTYPVAYALALSLQWPVGAPVRDAVLAAGFAWAENMVQAAIKSVPLGQSAGQRIVARLCRELPAAIDAALAVTDATRQSFSPMLAILSARHETQYSRIFRS
jgi:urease accessory protein